MRVLVVEDDLDLIDLLEEGLTMYLSLIHI